MFLFGLDKVNYDADTLMKFLKNAPMEMFRFFEELMKIYLMTKSPAWGYEQEVRIIRGKHGVLDIPSEFMEQVCFGLRTPPAEVDLIMKLAKKYCGCKKFCRMERDGSDFGAQNIIAPGRTMGHVAVGPSVRPAQTLWRTSTGDRRHH